MFNFIIETKKGYSDHNGPYNYSSSEKTKQELFDVDVPTFSDALALDKILSEDQMNVLVEFERMFGYSKMCEYAQKLEGRISYEQMILLLNGLDIEDIIMSHLEPIYIRWNNRHYNERFKEVKQKKWEKVWDTLKDKALKIVYDILSFYPFTSNVELLQMFNNTMSNAFDKYVAMNENFFSGVYRHTFRAYKTLSSEEFHKLLLENMAESALKFSYSDLIQPTDEEMKPLKFIPITSKGDEEEEDDFVSHYSENTFYFRPVVSSNNRVVVVEGNNSFTYYND